MVKNTNTRILITVSKAQDEWLKKTSKKLHISISKLVKYLISRNIDAICNRLTDQDIDYLVKIAHYDWLNIKNE